MRPAWLAPLLLAGMAGCGGAADGPYVLVLGVAQDGGYPQAACRKDCCRRAWERDEARRHVAALAIVDPATGSRWLVDATPDLIGQLHALDGAAPVPAGHGISGIFLTHAHIGHYAGLLHLGREAMGAWEVPVFAMPRMAGFLEDEGPWSQLVRLRNIVLRPLRDGRPVDLTAGVQVTPIAVPHRDEFSETVAFRIDGPSGSVLYLPDIDKWERWDRDLAGVLAEVDVAYLDGTFFEANELPGRDMDEIPHPLVVETMDRLASLPAAERAKVRFLHLNHSNPLLDESSSSGERVRQAGFRIARQGEVVPLAGAE